MLCKEAPDHVLRAHVARFGLGDNALLKIGCLSGGQKARLSLAVETWHAPEVLLLDEPTNHLDNEALDALSLGLQAFDGAVVMVSHNQAFIESVCNELWIVADGRVKVCAKGAEAFEQFFAKYRKDIIKKAGFQ